MDVPTDPKPVDVTKLLNNFDFTQYVFGPTHKL